MAACAHTVAQPPLIAASPSAVPSGSPSSSASAAPTLLPMSPHYGARTCGSSFQLGNAPRRLEVVREGGDACYSVAGCPAPDPEWTAETKDCPDWPVKTIDELVRHAESQPEEQNVIVRGRLVIANGHVGPRQQGGAPRPCASGKLLLSLEAEVDGACYAVDLHPEPRCDVDASRICCPHLPLGQETAVAGRLWPAHYEGLFAFGLDGRVCRLRGSPGTAASSSSSSSSARRQAP
jgi:hypothetical protein